MMALGFQVSGLRFQGRSVRSVGSMAILLFLWCAVTVVAPVSALASPLDDKIKAFGEATTQTAEAVEDVLKTGLSEKRSAEAYAAMSAWLAANPSDSQALLFFAGRTAEYAGEWTDAASFYRKLLKHKALNEKLAADVVPGIYRLLINNLGDENAAYLFMREEGNRLRGYGRARQFDRWFCEQALKRGDLTALAERLTTIYGNATETPTAADAEWVESLLGALETFEHNSEDVFAALKKLAAAPKTLPQTRARLEWAMAITPVIPELIKRFGKDIPDDLLVVPLKAASALLAADPQVGASLVVKGWTRWRQGDTPSFFRFVHARRDRKAEPFIHVLQTLPPEQARTVLAAGAQDYQGRWVSVASFIPPAQARSLIPRLSAIFNAIDAPAVEMWDKDIKLEEAKALAPHLVRNPHGHAALIRAYAVAGTNTVTAMVPVMMKSERWRFGSAKAVVDTVWNSGCDRTGAKDGDLVKQYEPQGERYDQFKRQVGKDADSKSRLTAFIALYQELLGTNPSTPGLLSLWDELLKQAPSADQEKILQKLAADFAAAPPAAIGLPKYFLSQALTTIDFGSAYARLTFGPEFAGGWDRWGYENVRKALPGLAADLGKLLRQQMGAGSLSEPVFGMWLHCVVPGTPDAKSLFEELAKSAAYDKMNPAYHKMAAHPLLFGAAALKPLPTDPRVVSRELLELPKDALAAAVETALTAVTARVAQSTVPVTVHGLQRVAAMETFSASARSLALSLFNQLSPLGAYPAGQGYEQLVLRLVKDMQTATQWGLIEPYLSAFWRSAGAPDDGRFYPAAEALAGFAEAALAANQPSVALSVARCGLASRVAALDPANPTDNAAQRRGRMQAIVSKAGQALGVSEIPVDATHPDYGIYKSNAEYVAGNLMSAWELYTKHAARLQPDAANPQAPSLLRKLPIGYAFWLMDRNIEEGRTDEAEGLVKELTIWSSQAAGTFSMEQEGLLKIAYADLAFRKGAAPTARAWYRKVADAREYQGSAMHVTAALGSVRIDRISKNFSSALEELEKLLRIPDASARVRVHYAWAEVLMDQENYKDALGEVDAVLRHAPNHADALILRGKIHFEMRKLMEASEIEVGVSQEDKVIVPGESLKVNLLDPTLSVSGVSAEIEVEVVAKSGDRERLMLHQLGDSKDKFRAEVPTALGPPVPGDKTLQVLGVDEIRYGYSARFRAKMKDLPPDPDVQISVASDAHLSLSAGAFPPREGERRLDIEELGLSSAQQALGMRAVRPGNPVYLRVIDPDRSQTAAVDEIAVSLSTSSGDEIRRLILKETGPYTGEFEAVVPTASAQAMAFASENAPGRDPNLAISPGAAQGWQGQVGDKDKPRTFGVDLNDNVPLDRMQVKWGAAEDGLTHFVLQTSMNGRDWVTRSRYPADPVPWDGRPRVCSFPTYGNKAMTVSEPKSWMLPSDWLEKMELTSARGSIDYRSQCVKNLSSMKPELVADGGHPGYSVLIQYRAVFHQPGAAIRRFQLTGYPAAGTIFLLDGQPAAEDADDPLLIERELVPGLHEVQVWRQEGRDALLNRKPVLLCDVPGQEALQPSSDSMFDPAALPEGLRRQIAMPATLTPGGAEGLDVTFAPDTQARLVRLVIQGFKGVAPVVQSVSLTDRDGKVRLPVAQDTMQLRQNMQLEVLPGDRITARYEDAVSATPKRDRHEQHLTVAFNDARIAVSFVDFETLPTGERRLLLDPIRRFRHGDAVLVVIDDVDMDGSPQRDQVDFRVITSDGLSATQKAVETEPHSGQFVGRIFPIKGTPARASEIQISEGGTLTATYRDMENLDPGIPSDRSVTVEHAQYVEPALGVYTVDSETLPRAPRGAAPSNTPAGAKRATQGVGSEVVTPNQALRYRYVDQQGIATADLSGVIGASLRFDVVVPHLALTHSSTISAYVQVSTNGAAAKDKPFDIMAPGTLKLSASPQGAEVLAGPGYTVQSRPVPPTNQPPLDEGRFAFSVPLLLGDMPSRSFATREAESLPSSALPEGLTIKAGDIVQVGYAWQDQAGAVQWKTASLKVVSHAVLDVMNDRYNEPLVSAFVGEKVFVRLVAYGLDTSDDRDQASVGLRAGSGVSANFALRETEPHTGVFKGVFAMSYADADVPSNLPPVELNGFPVRYGDQVTVSYGDQALTVTVNMGADGGVEPFSKRFTGDEMAVQTSFTLAECFFELAKKHRQMDQESLARREMAQAQKLLAEAIASHTDNSMRAHAEYLLGNLSQEYADLSKNDAAKLPMYQDALARFSKIPIDYPDTEFSPKAQFKMALVYEKMGEMEIAVEEYVKMAYKYPESEHIPEVMSRLGGYFQAKGQKFKEQADVLREKTDVQSQAEVLRLDELSYPDFLRAARVFNKLQQRFPDHELAGLAGLRAAQNFMRAHQYDEAISGFEMVFGNEQYDGREIRSQAMYWNGLSYERKAALMSEGNWKGRGEAINAGYAIYRRVTYDFPDSQWAKLARGRLADPVFGAIIEKEQFERKIMLEGLKEQKKKQR